MQTTEGLVEASLHPQRGLCLPQPHHPIIHLHNGCLFIHYANGAGGKLGNKGRRKEKIALACFNILFRSEHCVVFQRLNLQGPWAWEFVFTFLFAFSGKKRSLFFLRFSASFVEPTEQCNVEVRKKGKLRFFSFESEFCASWGRIFGKRDKKQSWLNGNCMPGAELQAMH